MYIQTKQHFKVVNGMRGILWVTIGITYNMKLSKYTQATEGTMCLIVHTIYI